MDNLAYDSFRENIYETHAGRKVLMLARAKTNHFRAWSNIFLMFQEHFEGKTCEVFGDGVDLFLSDEDNFVPDVMVVCDPSKVKDDGVYGAPDLVAEVLSPGTFRYDKGYKMKAYAKYGVKEYWLVDIESKSIEVYLLKDGRFELDNAYIIYDAIDLKHLTEEQISRIQTEFTVPSFPDLTVSLNRVFRRMINRGGSLDG